MTVDADGTAAERREVSSDVAGSTADVAAPCRGPNEFGEGGIHAPRDRLVVEFVSDLRGVLFSDGVVAASNTSSGSTPSGLRSDATERRYRTIPSLTSTSLSDAGPSIDLPW